MHELEIKMRVGVHPHGPERERRDETWGHSGGTNYTQMYFWVGQGVTWPPLTPLAPPVLIGFMVFVCIVDVIMLLLRFLVCYCLQERYDGVW